jgi:Fe-S cluster assembly protein SufD
MNASAQRARQDSHSWTLPAPPANDTNPHLTRLREFGAAAFAAKGFPTVKSEAWHFTNIAPLLAQEFVTESVPTPLARSSLPALVSGREAQHRMVFVNGRYRPDLSQIGNLPAGAVLLDLPNAGRQRPELVERGLRGPEALSEKPFAALNAAGLEDGFLLHVPGGQRLEAPLEVLWVGTGGERPPVYHTHNVIMLGSGAHATVVEHHVGLCIGSYLSNCVSEVSLGVGANLRHCKVQEEAREAFHIALMDTSVAAGAQFDSFVFSLGGRLARNEIAVRLTGRHAACRLNGAYLGRGEQHLDHTTEIEHIAAECASRQLYKGVLAGRARGVFQGKISVRPGAQKTDGHQLSRTLLLSDRAQSDAKPELEIFADDVKCSHGATVGQLDAAALFYLRARGIPEAEARRLLVEAFLGEVIGSLALTGMRLSLEHNVARWLGSDL